MAQRPLRRRVAWRGKRVVVDLHERPSPRRRRQAIAGEFSKSGWRTHRQPRQRGSPGVGACVTSAVTRPPASRGLEVARSTAGRCTSGAALAYDDARPPAAHLVRGRHRWRAAPSPLLDVHDPTRAAAAAAGRSVGRGKPGSAIHPPPQRAKAACRFVHIAEHGTPIRSRTGAVAAARHRAGPAVAGPEVRFALSACPGKVSPRRSRPESRQRATQRLFTNHARAGKQEEGP